VIKARTSTYDVDSWESIVKERDNPQIREALNNDQMVDVVFQFSDGDIEGDPAAAIGLLESMKVAHAGLAFGQDATAKLAVRHGDKNVITANTPEEMAGQFSKLLKKYHCR